MMMRKTNILMLIQKVLLISILLLIKNSSQQTNQTASISLTPKLKAAPSDCTEAQYFDNIELGCKSCPTNSQTSPNDKLNCRCLPTHYFNYNNGGGSVECKPCQVANQVQSLDGFSCILAPTLPGCDENGNSYESDTNEDGTSRNERRCVACNLQSSISLSSSCRGCRPYIFLEDAVANIDSIDCSRKYSLSIGGFYFLTATADGQPNYFRCPFDATSGSGGADCADSWYLASFSPAAYRTCRVTNRRNHTSCHQLANMCVLNLYGYSSGGVLDRLDVCKVFDRIYEADEGENMPWLRYPESYGEFKALYLLNGIDSEYLKIKFSSKCKLTPELNLYASEYTVDGKLTRFGRFDISKLQLCNLVSNLAQSSTRSPFSLTYLKQSCSLSLATLFDLADTTSLQTPFYDMFVEYNGNNGERLFPVPVKILNFKTLDTGAEVNRGGNENAHQHQRRFFLYETVSSKDTPNGRSSHIRYAKSISIVVDLITGKSDGEIYPPVITIEYATARRDSLTSNPSALVDVSFSIEYRMEINSFMLAVYISLGVLGLLAFFWTCIRLWNWNRRSGRYACDLITLFKFLLYLCNAIANSLFLIITVATLYWLIIYRGQTVAFLFLPSDSQESLFMILISVAFGLKLVDVIHLILLQCSYDIFFIDWERPPTTTVDPDAALFDGSLTRPILPPIKPAAAATSKKPGATAVQMDRVMRDELKMQNKVSCWRTLFVANEWNELQAYRKTSVTLQLVFALFLLKVINLEELALKDCSQNLFKDVNEYKAPFSLVLRIAIASSVLIGTWLVQSLIYVVIYSRFIEDKIGQFVDFCSISNISMFIMTHSQYGYYVHGRSPHGNADASMQKMTEALIREANDMTAKRGLENGSDHQTFSMAVPIKLTRQYFKVMRPLYERNSRSAFRRDEITSSNEFEKRMVAYTQLNKFLMTFINNALRDLNYTIVYRNLMENILGVEFRVPIDGGYFYRDDLTCFASTIFFGKERTLFLFDLLLFLFVDCFAQSYILAAFVVYIVANFITVIRADLGKRNISKKTLVDKRFLI